jgi:hypothetical protein
MNNSNELRTVRRALVGAVNLRQRRQWFADDDIRIADLEPWGQTKKPSTPTAPAVQHDQYQVDYVTRPFDQAWEKAQRIAANKDLKPEARNRDITAYLNDARSEIVERERTTIAELEAEKAKLEAKTQRDTTPPSADEIVQLNYVRDMLRGGNYNDFTLEKAFQQAIEAGDKVTARVFLDFGEQLVREKREPRYRDMPLSARFKELTAKADELLASDEQRKARERIRRIEATIPKVKFAKTEALDKMQGWGIERDGTLVDGRTLRQNRQFRRML